jgi:hypothetical protein
MHRVTP